MAKEIKGSRRQHQRSTAVPSRSSSGIAKRSPRGSDAPSQAAALRLGTTSLRHGSSNRGHSAIQNHTIPERQRTLSLRSRQRVRRVDLRLLRRIISALLRETWPHGNFDLAIYVVAEPEMIRLNETYLRHKGSTDVITFDYAEKAGPAPRPSGSDARGRLLHGEIFVCVDDSVSQAPRFHATWQNELVRYVVHGLLHLLGYDDRDRGALLKMNGAENSLMHQLAHQFDLSSLGASETRNRA